MDVSRAFAWWGARRVMRARCSWGRLSESLTLRAQAVQRHFVTFEGKPFGDERIEFSGTPAYFEDARAAAAPEVMMVSLTGDFVARRFAGEFDGGEPSAVDKRRDGAVDGGDPQAFDMGAASVEDLGGSQRSPRLFKDSADGITLTGAAFHSQ
jgi:hypothetical protein